MTAPSPFNPKGLPLYSAKEFAARYAMPEGGSVKTWMHWLQKWRASGKLVHLAHYLLEQSPCRPEFVYLEYRVLYLIYTEPACMYFKQRLLENHGDIIKERLKKPSQVDALPS